jgi:hypothetical protein
MKKAFKIIVGTIFTLALIGYYFGGGIEKQVANEMQKIENQVAKDMVEQYKIAKLNGSAIDAYVQAGMVAAAFLQANDSENYKKWKEVEKKEAKNAGL